MKARHALFAAFALGLSGLVHANGILQSMTGSVQVNQASSAVNQRVTPGSTVTTGPKSQAILRLDDGATLMLHENTQFRIDQYSFDRARPEQDNIAVRLLQGALRSVSGLIGSRNRSKVAFIAPQATLGIRGTDFMLVLLNPAYMSVLEGAIDVSNAAGSATFGAGATAVVETAASLAVAIPAASLPAVVQQIFQQLAAIPVPSASSAVSAAQGGIGSIALPLAAAIGIAAAIAGGSSDDPAASSTGTVGTTGTTGTR